MYNLSLMLLLAILICWLCRRIVSALSQPAFIGDILAGILIGPSFLGGYLPVMWPAFDTVGFVELLRGLSEVGLIWILIEVVWCASHIDDGSLKQKSVLIIALFSIVIPFLVGVTVGYYSKDDLAFDQSVIGYVLFCGIAFSVTALPVLAIIIDRLKFISRSIGSLALAVAIYTDAFAWMALALVVGVWGVSGDGDFPILLRYLGLIFFCLVIVVIKWLISIFDVEATSGRSELVLLMFLFVISSANLTHGLGFHSSIGAIAAAFALTGIKGLRGAWEQWAGNLRLVMIPMFFIGTGTMLTFSDFNEAYLWLWVAAFVIAGVISKVISSFLAGLLVGMSKQESLELGLLMATKGTAELVVLSVGHSASLLSDNSYMVLLLLSVVSTLLTAPMIILLNTFRSGKLKPL